MQGTRDGDVDPRALRPPIAAASRRSAAVVSRIRGMNGRSIARHQACSLPFTPIAPTVRAALSRPGRLERAGWHEYCHVSADARAALLATT